MRRRESSCAGVRNARIIDGSQSILSSRARVGRAWQDGQLCRPQRFEVADEGTAKQSADLDGVFRPNDIGVADDQQGRELQACHALPGP
jgi:hypothetical protein